MPSKTRRSKTLAVGVCLLLAIVAANAAGLTVTFPSAKGQYTAQFEDAKNRPLGKAADYKDVASTELTIPDGDPVTLVVTDDKTENAAAVKFYGRPIKLTDKDFVYTAVKVTVQHDGKAVASANVHLKDATGDHTELLAPDSKGEVTFSRVHLGKVVGTVEYTVSGEKKTSDELHTNIDAKRDEKTPTLAFSIPDKVATVGDQGEKKVAVPAEAQEHTGGGGMIAMMVLALVAGLAALGGILYFVQRKPDWTRQKMEKFGVQLPSDPAADPATTHTSGFRSDPPPPPPIVPPGTCPFCGGPEGACACSPGAPTTATAVATAPRLLALAGPYAGQPFDAQSDQISVGREPGNDVCLERDTSISRRHARILRQGGEMVVEDLGSTNGTFVNGAKVQGQQTIRPGDTVQFGESQFKYEA